MNIKRLSYSPIDLIVCAGRTCTDTLEGNPEAYVWDVIDGDGKNFITGLIQKGHESVIEHVYYTFHVDGLSRAALQELARHRLASYSVKSTRYTLKKLLDSTEENLRDQFVHTGDYHIDELILNQMISIHGLLRYNQRFNISTPNDKLKYALPEAFKTTVVFTINARSLRNFLKLRSSKRALWEMRELAAGIYDHLPMDHKFMFEDVMTNVEGES